MMSFEPLDNVFKMIDVANKISELPKKAHQQCIYFFEAIRTRNEPKINANNEKQKPAQPNLKAT